MAEAGYLYVLTNAGLPGVLRVGRTRGEPQVEAERISAAWNAPAPFSVAWQMHFRDSWVAERRLIGVLEEHGIQPAATGEIFDATLGTVLEAMEQVRTELDAEQHGRLPEPAAMAEANAFVRIGDMFAKGDGGAPDLVRANLWFHRGAEAGCRRSMARLALLPSTDAPAALEWMRRFCEGLDDAAAADIPENEAIALLHAYVALCRRMKRQGMDRELILGALRALEGSARHVQDSAQAEDRLLTIRELRKLVPEAAPSLKWAFGAAGAVVLCLVIGYTWSAAFVLRSAEAADSQTPPVAAAPAPEAEPPRVLAEIPLDLAPKTAPVPPPASVSSAGPAPVVRKKGTGRAEGPAQAVEKVTVAKAAPPPQVEPPEKEDAKETPQEPEAAEEGEEKEQPAAPPAPEESSLNSNDLVAQFADKRKAEAELKNTEVRITDTVTGAGRREISFGKVKCKLDADAQVERGARATVEGTVRGKSFLWGTITLQPCRIVE